MKYLTLFIFFIGFTQAQANQNVGFKFQGSGEDRGLQLNYGYSQESQDDESLLWSTNLMLANSRSRLFRSQDGPRQSNRSLSWENTFDTSGGWSFGAIVDSSNAQIDEIRTIGLSLFGGRTREVNKNFALHWQVEFGGKSIKQTEAATSGAEELKITQTHVGLEVGFFSGPFDGTLSYQKFNYNQDIDQQIQLLSSADAMSLYGSAFSSRLTTLIDSQLSLDFGWQFHKRWNWSLGLSRTVDAPQPQIVGMYYNTQLAWKFTSSWRASVELGTARYNTTPVNSYSFAGLGFNYSF